jgi:hypothetical protein
MRIEVYGSGSTIRSWSCWLLLVAIGLACQPARGGDRKSGSRQGQEAAADIVVARKAHAVSLRDEVLGSLAVRPLGARDSVSTGDGSKEKAKGNGAMHAREHKPLTLFHINSKLGDIMVQPVVGNVNGAQFSLGF